MGWAPSGSNLPLTVVFSVPSFGDVTVGDTTGTTNIRSASFGAGRGDWFDTLSPSSGTFTFDGTWDTAVGAPIVTAIGSLVTVACDDTLWTGAVDTVIQDTDTSGHTVTTVTATDYVGNLGQARIEDAAISSGTLAQQVVSVFAQAGLTVSVDEIPSGRTGATLAAVATLSGSIVDWFAQAEQDANTLIVPNRSGTATAISLLDRGRFGDYGDRVASTYYVGAAATSLWRMDEASGNLADSIGAITGTAAGTPVYGNDGPWGASGPDAVGFQKADAADKFTFGDNYDLTGATFTIAGWLYWFGDASTVTPILHKQTATNGWHLSITTGSKLRFDGVNASSSVVDVSSSTNIPTNTWTHVAVSVSGGTCRILLDGVLSASGAHSAIGASTQTLTMGNNAASLWFGGRMCMVSIWSSTALTATDLMSVALLDYRDLTGSLAPYGFTKALDITTVINHWIFRQPTVTSYTDATSITAYGDHTFELETDSGSTALSTTYSSANRSTLDQPRYTARAQFHITSDAQQTLANLKPLDFVRDEDGTAWQVMSVQHDISPETWDLTVELSGTVADLTGVGSALP